MHFHKLRIRISLLWLPYLLMLPYLPVARLIGWIFIMLTIHEMAHMLCAILFHYPIERINIYPFGLAATITHIGHGSLVKEILIISAGPLMHVLFPSLFQFCVAKGILSPSFASYLHTINASAADLSAGRRTAYADFFSLLFTLSYSGICNPYLLPYFHHSCFLLSFAAGSECCHRTDLSDSADFPVLALASSDTAAVFSLSQAASGSL